MILNLVANLIGCFNDRQRKERQRLIPSNKRWLLDMLHGKAATTQNDEEARATKRIIVFRKFGLLACHGDICLTIKQHEDGALTYRIWGWSDADAKWNPYMTLVPTKNPRVFVSLAQCKRLKITFEHRDGRIDIRWCRDGHGPIYYHICKADITMDSVAGAADATTCCK